MIDEDAPEGWCDACGRECHGVRVDEGIGPYEFWGQRGNHHDYVFKSHCCTEEILDHDPFCTRCGKREIYDYGLCLKCYEITAEEV